MNTMLRKNTPVEHYPELRLFVKREDLACPPPGPPFSKTRGVYAHIRKVAEDNPKAKTFGALDTYHSQAGHAVARACQILGLKCVNYYPEYAKEPGPRPPQIRARDLGAKLEKLPAGMSAVLYHQAKRHLRERYGKESYMMPNALKLDESVSETATEVGEACLDATTVIVPVSSGTIASGVIRGFLQAKRKPRFILHLGYSRSHEELLAYIQHKVGMDLPQIDLIDEGYAYKQAARWGQSLGRDLPPPPFPCSPYYDLKALQWWMAEGRKEIKSKKVLLWNIG